MKSEYETVEDYFAANEKKSNRFFSYIIFGIIPVYPIIMLLVYKGIFPPANFLRLAITGLITTIFSLIFFIKTKKTPDDKGNKYLLLLLTQPVIFTISLEKGIHLSILFTLVPLSSCIYYDLFFTSCCIVSGYITLFSSYFFKSLIMEADSVRLSRFSWFTVYVSGATIEYIFVILFCILLTREIRNIVINNYSHKDNLKKIQTQLILGFSNIIEMKEIGGENHIKRTCEYVRLIGNKLRKQNAFNGLVTANFVDLMVRAVPFHDIGKIAVPTKVLNKEGKLSTEEYNLIKKHIFGSAEFITRKLNNLDDPELLQVAYDMALYHHERIDGNGYPYNLSGESIPLAARILAVADITDALLSKRAYKEAYSLEKTFSTLRQMAGESLDPVIVETLLSCSSEVNLIRKGEYISEN